MIITHLRDIINDHKAHGKLKVHSSNDYEGEWKENGKFNYQKKLILFLLNILMKFI